MLQKETTESSKPAFVKSNENTKIWILQSSHLCTLQTTGIPGTVAAYDSYSLKHGAVILVSPDENLCDGADGLHKKVSVVVGNCGVFGEDMVHVPADNSTKNVERIFTKGQY